MDTRLKQLMPSIVVPKVVLNKYYNKNIYVNISGD